ncbi:hypothetical protein F2Q70_00016544 [Brassica cretica]|uniref:RNase H type-1 domain-containing protein n=1 Tax=Brassica cretica TaxID=69181 RepID=A0A8S9I3V9_BRACR|nr:hypothetical protein F2Q70_00016544 [Brassica cretica]KAF2597144.1 hypothetical protein F2Q68_00009502 [Brassica cretica]
MQPSFSLNNVFSGTFEIHLVSRSIIDNPDQATPEGGSTTQDTALALRSALLTAVNLELSTLKMLSYNSTLVRAINNNIQNKEIYGIVKDIQQFSYGFVDISFLHFLRCCNVDTNRLAKPT